MDLKRGIDKAVAAVVENLKSKSEVGSNDNKTTMAVTISANNDSIGELDC